MKIVVDENVSLGLIDRLKRKGHTVTAIAEIAKRGMADEEVWDFVKQAPSVLITRDYHFTNPSRFHPSEIEAIIFIRPGNLSASEEISLVEKFIDTVPFESYRAKLVTITKKGVRFR